MYRAKTSYWPNNCVGCGIQNDGSFHHYTRELVSIKGQYYSSWIFFTFFKADFSLYLCPDCLQKSREKSQSELEKLQSQRKRTCNYALISLMLILIPCLFAVTGNTWVLHGLIVSILAGLIVGYSWVLGEQISVQEYFLNIIPAARFMSIDDYGIYYFTNHEFKLKFQDSNPRTEVQFDSKIFCRTGNVSWARIFAGSFVLVSLIVSTIVFLVCNLLSWL